MISFLKGIVENISVQNNRNILILEVNNIGYEIQVPSHFARELKVNDSQIIQIYTHFLVRDEQQILYGFPSSTQRDLFRRLISVSGVGSQSAIALIDTLALEELVQAIVTGNIRVLSQAPGIGKKTAERIALELKTKLSQWRTTMNLDIPVSKGLPSQEIIADVEMTLLALGYNDVEIQQAMSVISQDNLLLKNPHVEEWIRSAIEYLSLNS
jgi:Holliday junction DNA helicase RuvA